MPSRRFILTTCFLAMTLGAGCVTSSPPAAVASFNANVAPRAILLPPSLQSQKAEVRADVDLACRLVGDFAAGHGWTERVGDCFYDHVEVFETQPEVTTRIIALHHLPPETKLPTGVVAALEKRVLIAVAPDENHRLNPEYTRQEDAWARLLAHEIGHRLHIAILDGDEDAMGPVWFFEGFAVVAAGQKLGAPLSYTSAEAALEGCRSKAPLAYRRYGAAVRYFMTHLTLSTLVKRASSADFEDWLLTAGDAARSQ